MTKQAMPTQNEIPVLYSFRRCPYAMRARLVLWLSQQRLELREILLKDKPAHLLELSPKGTVPVLWLRDSQKVLDESLDIMLWSLERNDPMHLLPDAGSKREEQLQLIARNDDEFKSHLDRYKYAQRDAETSAYEHREQAEAFIQHCDTRLSEQRFLFGDQMSLADVAIMPFIRQFSRVDDAWFQSTSFLNVQHWLRLMQQTEMFQGVMKKYPVWVPGDAGVDFP